MAQNLTDWSHFWESGDYLLLLSGGDKEHAPGNCSIYNIKDRSIVRIEDDELFTELLRHMHKAGVPIVPNAPPGESIIDIIVRMAAEQRNISVSLNPLLREANAMEKAGRSQDEIVARIRKLLENL